MSWLSPSSWRAPQQLTVPLLWRAHACTLPPTICTPSVIRVSVLTLPPVYSRSRSFQHFTMPLCSSAHVCSPYCVSCTTLLTPSTATERSAPSNAGKHATSPCASATHTSPESFDGMRISRTESRLPQVSSSVVLTPSSWRP